MTAYADRLAVCAVVVTFHPELERLAENIAALAPQVAQIVLVDNASSDQSRMVETLHFSAGSTPCLLLANSCNAGVAVAQNQGIEWATTNGFPLVLLMDQDSKPAIDMVSRLVDAYERLVTAGVAVSAVGPCHCEAGETRAADFKSSVNGSSPVTVDGVVMADYLIASGMLTSCAVFATVGMMEEGLFIDRVDTEWFLRAGSRGYQAFGVPMATMIHQLGERRLRIWLGRWRFLPQHVPIRQYYQVRNSLLLYRRVATPWRWIVMDVCALFGVALLGIVCMPERMLRLRLLLRGILDGMLGRSGPLGMTDAS